MAEPELTTSCRTVLDRYPPLLGTARLGLLELPAAPGLLLIVPAPVPSVDTVGLDPGPEFGGGAFVPVLGVRVGAVAGGEAGLP